ncbi:MAG: GspE/PulE family protein [Planctomycetota bacterium]|jgi:type II secretory ATPase GspE/PulE/Tfp pilus assembly ATPase PilB-like protein
MARTNEKNNTDAILENGSYPDPLNTFILNAIIEGATDVHLHAVDEGTVILYRVDGVVHEKQRLSVEDGRRLINQIKAVAGLNVTRSFSPQEAQIRWLDEDGKNKDFRVTVVPIGAEECAHLRILSMPEKDLDMGKLGFSDEHSANIAEILDSLNGLILVTGVTGSGKTTTMYSMASSKDLRSLVAFSIEDPVEFKLPNGQQLEVDEEHGLTMYEGLRTILRMDPDLIMVGEIRDRDSAIVTARAALSGRLVFGTIHGQDAAGAVDALHYLGVPYYIISNSLRMIIAQKLLRRLCLSCAKPRELYAEEREVFERAEMRLPKEVFDSVGCEKCSGYGYKGRIGIFETAVITPEAAHKIASGMHNEPLRQHFRDSGVAPMTVDGLTKVADGITSMQELFEKCNFPGLLAETQSGIRESIMI